MPPERPRARARCPLGNEDGAGGTLSHGRHGAALGATGAEEDRACKPEATVQRAAWPGIDVLVGPGLLSGEHDPIGLKPRPHAVVARLQNGLCVFPKGKGAARRSRDP